MDYIKQAEKVLDHYRDLQNSLVNMDRQIARLMRYSCPKQLSGSVMDETGIRAGRHVDTLTAFCDIVTLRENREETKDELAYIDYILDSLSDEPKCELYGKILTMWYIDGMPKEEIADKVGYSSRQSIYSIRKLAITKFAIRLFGKKALVAV